MKKIYSVICPKQVDNKRENNGFIKRILNYNIHEVTDSELKSLWNDYRESIMSSDSSIELPIEPERWFKEGHTWEYNQIELPMSDWSREKVVEAIIRDKYSQDEMEAITNNMAAVNAVFMQTLVSEGIVGAIQYLKDSYDKDNAEIFKSMQEWRHMAKQEAKSIFINE